MKQFHKIKIEFSSWKINLFDFMSLFSSLNHCMKLKLIYFSKSNYKICMLFSPKKVAEKVEDYTKDRERLKSELEALRKENDELNLIKDSHDTLLNSAEEIHTLNKKLIKIEEEKTNLFKDNMKLKQESSKNAKNQEIIKTNLNKIQLLENERYVLSVNFTEYLILFRFFFRFHEIFDIFLGMT